MAPAKFHIHRDKLCYNQYMINSTAIWIVGIFFLIIFLIGVWDRKKVGLADYWVNSRKTNKFVLVATLVSSFIGVGALLSNASIAYSGGGLATLFLLSSMFVYFLIYARFFAPKIKEFGDTHGAFTLPDFLKHRYSKAVQVAGMVVNLITYALWLALQILGLGVFVAAVGGLDPIWATAIGGGIVVLYTTIGGLRADIRTDIFQFIVMLGLLAIFLPMLIAQGGGFQAITNLPASFLGGSEFAPWYVFVFGFLFLGATNITSSDIWQRTYAGDTAKNVKWAMTVGAFVTFAFIIMGTLLGIYGHILLPGIEANMVVPQLLNSFLSPVMFGVVLAGFFAAIMSSADTMLLIMSMTIVHDLTQETFIKVHRGLKELEEPRKFKGWLCSIVRTTCVDWLRKEKVRPASLDRLADDGIEPAGKFIGGAFKQTSTEEEELKERILNIVNTLPKIYQEIILLRHLRKFTYREMSDFLGLPIATIESRLYRARLMLKEGIKELYI